ncbi:MULTISPECIES: hypothetical protein [unclassified Acinetobacter]|uniref:hypothetical protein n=1 Tax=unclassified Acinetobacter TaxID=196816 RepID=UPI0035B74E8E
MNAPRQGLFASLLILSFILHSILIVAATQYYLDDMREVQGDSIAGQLVKDSVNQLDPANTVGLALIASRYATDPAIASLRILDKNNQTLATAGNNKTRDGEIFVRDAVINDQKVGKVEIVLISPSLGEQLTRLWLPILLVAFLHLGLWVTYRLVARPSRSDYIEQLRKEQEKHHEILLLKDQLLQTQAELKTAKLQAANTTTQAQASQTNNSFDIQRATNAVNNQKTATQAPFVESDHVYLHVQYDDPKQLLDTLSPSNSQSLFNLSQTFLNQAVALSEQYFKLPKNSLKIIKNMSEQGAVVRIDRKDAASVQALLQVATVYQILSERTYARLREQNRFALHSRCAVSEDVAIIQMPAEQAAQGLLQYIKGQDIAVYLSKVTLHDIQHHYTLKPLPRMPNSLTREARILASVSQELAEVAHQMWQKIFYQR